LNLADNKAYWILHFSDDVAPLNGVRGTIHIYTVAALIKKVLFVQLLIHTAV